MTRHRTPAVEVAVVVALVVASVVYVVIEKRPGDEPVVAAGPRPEPAGLSWQWHPPGDPDAVPACQRVADGAIGGDVLPARPGGTPGATDLTTGAQGDAPTVIPPPTATWRGATVDCLEVAGVSWGPRWQNLAAFSLRELAEASLGVRNVPRGAPPLPPPDVCTNPGARDIVAHLVRCALPAPEPVVDPATGQVMVGQVSGEATEADPAALVFCAEHTTFPGGFGLASDWLDRPLAEIEGGRERVSACLMAHANAAGQQVRLRLESPGFDMPITDAWPSLLEGAFAGNLFPGPDAPDADDPDHLPFGLYACQADGYDRSEAPPGRVCTLDAAHCGFARTRCANTTGSAICERNPEAPNRDRDFFADCDFPGAWDAAGHEVVTAYVSAPDRVGQR